MKRLLADIEPFGRRAHRSPAALTFAILLSWLWLCPVQHSNARQPAKPAQAVPSPTEVIRFATFNVSFFRRAEGELAAELEMQQDPQMPRIIAEIIQRVRPQVLLLSEFDYDAKGRGIEAFQKHFLEVPQGDQKPIRYPYRYTAPVNTGVDSGIDLDGDGKTGGPNDCYGFGRYPGQYGMVVLSQLPIADQQVRTFQKFLWKDMPEHQMPLRPGTETPFYSAAAVERFRLSSKSHWDVPIQVGGQTIHFLVSHPTPPVFDGPEDRNGTRNHDEIRLWADYISPEKSSYLIDDQGNRGGLGQGAQFVIAGDLNADPHDGDSRHQAIRQLTEHPLIDASRPPRSPGAELAAQQQGGKNAEHRGEAAQDTGDFGDDSVGNLRLDYCLPSRTLKPVRSGVFWPTPDQPEADLLTATDHRMVWIDVQIPE